MKKLLLCLLLVLLLPVVSFCEKKSPRVAVAAETIYYQDVLYYIDSEYRVLYAFDGKCFRKIGDFIVDSMLGYEGDLLICSWLRQGSSRLSSRRFLLVILSMWCAPFWFSI